MNTTWRAKLKKALDEYKEIYDDVVSITLSETELDVVFDDGFGGSEGIAFTAWTSSRVYFPAVYDGAEWVSSVSRNPDGVATPHVGGE